MKYTDPDSQFLNCIMTHSTCYLQSRTITPKGFVVHSTGCNAPNLSRWVQPYAGDNGYDYLINYLGVNQYGSDWNHTTQWAGVFGWLGKAADGSIGFVQTLPFNQENWGVGTGWTGYGLNYFGGSGYLQMEICEDGLNDYNYFKQTYDEACEVVAGLCVKYGWNPLGTNYIYGYNIPVIISHYESYQYGFGTGHVDPDGHWWCKWGVTMDDFRNDVYNLIQNRNKEEDDMDQNTFNQMANTWLGELAGKPTSDWAADAMDWAKSEGIMVGDEAGNDMGQKFMTRQELAAVLQRILEK